MAIFDSWMVQLGDLWNGKVEALHCLLQLDEGLDLIRVGQFLGAQGLDLLLILHGDLLKDGRLELLPGQTGQFCTLLAESRVDLVDLRVYLVLTFHLDQLVELGDGQIEELLGEHMLVLLYVLGLDCHDGLLQQDDALIEAYIGRAWAIG